MALQLHNDINNSNLWQKLTGGLAREGAAWEGLPGRGLPGRGVAWVKRRRYVLLNECRMAAINDMNISKLQRLPGRGVAREGEGLPGKGVAK